MQPNLNYLKYDQRSTLASEFLKKEFEQMTRNIDIMLKDSREKALIMTNLEIAYMWTGKAIRNDQILRTNIDKNVPGRTNQ